jgi:hypothetical protein
MYVLLYCLVLFALSVAFVSMTYVWFCAILHALQTRQSHRLSAGRRALWVTTMVVFGWLGAALYWTLAYPRAA